MAAQDIRDVENENLTFNHIYRGLNDSQVSYEAITTSRQKKSILRGKLQQTTYKILEKLEENLSLFHGGLVPASDEDPCACS